MRKMIGFIPTKRWTNITVGKAFYLVNLLAKVVGDYLHYVVYYCVKSCIVFKHSLQSTQGIKKSYPKSWVQKTWKWGSNYIKQWFEKTKCKRPQVRVAVDFYFPQNDSEPFWNITSNGGTYSLGCEKI